MRKTQLTTAIICMSFIFACNSNNNEEIKTPPEKEVIDTVSNNNSADSTRTIINRSMIWTVEQQSPKKDKLKAPDSTQINSFSASQLIDLLNQNYPDIHLNLVKISHDTMYVNIPESQKLTNEIGDTGAENYLASTTFTLTELKNIKFVNINMQAGDHAEPGVYSRDDFKNLR
ncbi:MAG: hypothetical protein ABI267_04985 [Ginsengibacter sp.]